jgi:hypothetical protein
MANRQQFQSLLKSLPISINNLADPAILRDSTAAKLDALCEDGHLGPVALITKGDLSQKWWAERLPGWASKLNLFVFASVSELPRSMEPAGTECRYRTMRAARDAGAKSIAYVRPIIHTINDSPETIGRIFRRSVDSGCHAIISSGFRGDDGVVEDAGMKDVPAPDGQQWMRTLKLTPQVTADFMRELAEELKVSYWTRTMCAVAALSGQPRSLSPYHVAPKFVRCDLCPLKASCADAAQFQTPTDGAVELLRYLGYQVEVHTATERYKACDVQVRSECTLCCTNCPTAPANLGVPYVNIRRWDGGIPSWGDMSFARFLTGGMLCTDPAVPPGENSEVNLHPRFQLPDGREGAGQLYGVNSWMVWSEYLPKNKCLRCSYCFLKMFEDTLPPELQVTVGMSPSRILDFEVEAAGASTQNRLFSLPILQGGVTC